MSEVTAVVPAWNESGRIIETLHRLQPFVDEIVVVDDASTDHTAEAAESVPGTRVIRQPRNGGNIEAIKAGFQAARGEIVVTVDADGEFPAEVIPALLAPIRAGRADMVQGHRNRIVRPSEKVLTWLAQRKGPVGDSGTGLRALRTELARTLELHGACICGIFSLEVLAKGGRIEEVPVQLQPIDKPRGWAWFHIRQFFILLPWLLRRNR